MLTILAVAAVIAVAVIGFPALTLWRQQERIVFQPPPPPHPGDGGARRIDFQASDGQPLFAYLVGGEQLLRGLVIVFHGNADLAGWQIPWAREVASRTGRSVLIAEYRGYGGLPGTPGYAESRLDARAVYAVARDSLGIPPERIAFFGHSLGSAIATELAVESQPEVMVLIAPLTSIREMAHLISPAAVVLYWARGVRVHYDTESLVRSLASPVWVAHGSNDRVVPDRMGRRVFDAARIKGELLIVPDAGHSDIVAHGGERYWQWLTSALSPRR